MKHLQPYAPNLISTGETVIMDSGAPKLKADFIKHGLRVIELNLPELKKGGGSMLFESNSRLVFIF